MVFTEVNCPGDHAEDVRWVRGLGGIVMYACMSGNDGYHRMVEIHDGLSVVVGGAFGCVVP